MDPQNERPAIRRNFERRIMTESEYFNGIRDLKKRKAIELQNDKIMIEEWFLMTGETMDSEDLSRFKSNYSECYGACLQPKDFERLKATWLMLTGTIDLTDLRRLKRNYILMDQSRINHHDFLVLKKFWPLVSGYFDPNDLETLQKDYLVLNWTKMSELDYTTFKTNWLALAESKGIDNQENIVRGWLMNGIQYIEYRYMNEKRKIEFTKFYFDRGADVNYSCQGDTLLHTFAGDRLMLIPPMIELLLTYGADFSLRDPNGRTVLDIIRIFWNTDYDLIINMLQEANKAVRNRGQID